uniref:Uncharacterized protein n=1 Tax=viral metagenome TaxID=1070528 RepID=A0A6M3L2K3_9ZZZZ
MKKLLVLFVALLLAGSAYALNETASYGPQNITSCFAKDMNLVSGDVVVLQTTSPTYPGREVTGSSTVDQQIYGIVVDGNVPASVATSEGGFVRVQTYGYCPIINVTTGGAYEVKAAIAVGDGLSTSGLSNRAGGQGATAVTFNVVALEAVSLAGSTTISGWISW